MNSDRKQSKKKGESKLVIAQPNPKASPQPLLYYDPELQDAGCPEEWTEESYARFQKATEKAKQLRRDYNKQLAKLRPRLSKETYSLFEDERQPLFDSNLLEFTLGDSLKRYRTRGFGFTTNAAAKFLDFDMKTIHLLRYREIDALNVNLPSGRWYEANKSIGGLLANELTAVNRTHMEHKLLFASGAVISVTFSRVMWSTERMPR